MRKIIWVFIILVCLIPVTFIARAYIKSPSKKVIEAQNNFIAINHQYVDGQQIVDVATLGGDDPNAEFVRIFANYLNKVTEHNDRLAKVKNALFILAQPGNQVNQQSIFEMQEKQGGYDKEIASIQADMESAIQDLVNKINALNKKGLKIADPVAFAESMQSGKLDRDKEMQRYTGLSVYIKTMLEFIKTRNGYYQLGADGSLHFARMEDQAYYNQLVVAINQYGKNIDDSREQDNMKYRKWVNDISPATK